MAAHSSRVLFEWAGTRFEWDANKNVANVAKHGLSFENAARAFAEPVLRRLDARHEYGEKRWIALGVIDGLAIAVVYTLRLSRLRIISARKANKHERKAYHDAVTKARTRQSPES